MKFLALIFVAVFSTNVMANTYLQINGASLHDQSGYNGFNYGAGIEQSVTDRWSVAGGWYLNSEYRGSTYAYARYAFYKKDSWDLGIAIGAVSGYQRAAVVPMAFPEVCYGWLCVVAFPKVEATGANVIALRFKIPVN